MPSSSITSSVHCSTESGASLTSRSANCDVVLALQLLPLRQERAAFGFVAAVGAKDEDLRGLGRPERLEQGLGAVGVAPLQVVDEPDDR